MKGGLILLKYLLPLCLIFALLVSVPLMVYAEEVVVEDWVALYNGPQNGEDEAIDIAIDLLGNVYVTGTSYGDATGYDYVTIKYDPNGNQLWERRYYGQWINMWISYIPGWIYFPGDGNDKACAIAVDSSRNVYVTGTSYHSDTGYDYATVKYDPNGNQLWERRYTSPGNSYDEVTDIAIDVWGNVYVTGTSDVEVYPDFATVKYDPNGNQLWMAQAQLHSQCMSFSGCVGYANAIVVDTWGNVYVTGKIQGVYSSCDYATVKYDPNGNPFGVKIYNGPGNGNDEAIDIDVDTLGNVYVTGTSYSSETYYDYATVKYDPNGNQLWVKRYGSYDFILEGKNNDYVSAIAVDSSGNVYVTGKSETFFTFYDYATVKYDTNGNQLWVKRYNGLGPGLGYIAYDEATAIAVDPSGNVYVTGKSLSLITCYDYATVKYDTNGNQLWVKYNGVGIFNDEATAIAVDPLGNAFVTGKSNCICGDTNATSCDYTTVKYKNICIDEIEKDEFEPDDDPNQILLEIYRNDITHKIVVNDPPQRHTFYCEDPNGCIDIDFVYFYGLEGHFYEICARDLSENNYPIQLALYDTNIQLLYEDGKPLISNNYLAFHCNQSGYYMVMARSDTIEPIKLLCAMIISSPVEKKFGTVLLDVIVPQGSKRPCVRWKQSLNDYDQLPGGYLFIYPDTHYYKINQPAKDIIIKAYSSKQCIEKNGEECGECNGEPLGETSVVVEFQNLNKATIDLSNFPDPNYIIPDPKYDDANYIRIISGYESDTQKDNYHWADITLPGDMDSLFLQGNDYDGDQIFNLEEIFCYGSYPHYPTFTLPLHQGINLYYFPSINEWSNTIPCDQILFYHYDETWKKSEVYETIRSNTFNAIYTPSGGTLSLDLCNPNYSVFCLGRLLDPNHLSQQDTGGYLNEYEVWSRFIQIDGTTDINFPTLRWDPDEIAIRIGSAALINGDPNRRELLVGDMSTNDIDNYKTKRQDAIAYFPLISVALFSYDIMPYNKAFDLDIDIPAGWSMISLPIVPNSAKVLDLFPDAKIVYGYETGKGYVRIKNKEDLQVRKGYWILLDKKQSYKLTGQPIPPNPLPVYKNGWDMIGGLSFKARASMDKGDIGVIYRYDQEDGYQRIPESEYLEPGKGYWILRGIS